MATRLEIHPSRTTDFVLTEADRPRIEGAIEAGLEAARRLKGSRGQYPLRPCPVRIPFIRRSQSAVDSGTPQPMMYILGDGGGRGGDVRLKLYLSLLWVSSGANEDGDHTTEIQAAEWARLLGLPGYSTRGKRRVLDAINWLDAEGYIKKCSRAGAESVLVVKHESGSGVDYTKPSENPPSGVPTYRRLQPELWTHGWLATLSGRAVALWLVVLDQTKSGDDTSYTWVGEALTTKRYGMSPYLRQAAMRELIGHGLITKRTKRIGGFGAKKQQTQLAVNASVLAETPQFAARHT